MDWNKWLPFVLILLFLVFCCGPMLMMGRHSKGKGKDESTKPNTGTRDDAK